MSDLKKTLGFVVVAALLAAGAFYSAPSSAPPELFDDVGSEFFPEFTDPTSPSSLEVLTYDRVSAEVKPFKVENRAGRWTIPSHHGYPADAEDQMATAAGLFVGLEKLDIRSNSKDQHGKYGVIDPEENTLDGEGVGTKVSFRDTGGNPLASLIIGSKVEGKRGMNYVRIPGTNATYVAKIPAQLSTAFEDWIDTELLDLRSNAVTRLVFDHYSINEETGRREGGDATTVTRGDREWSVSGATPDQEANKDTIDEVNRALASLEIVGVRPKPEGLTGQLSKAGGIQLTRRDLRSLQTRGFYLGSDGTLYSNEGDLIVESKKGIEYTLRFGEIIFGSGDAVTAGVDDAADEEKTPSSEIGPPGPGEDQEDGAGASRYLMVMVRFVEELIERPAGSPLSGEQIKERASARRTIEEMVSAVEEYRTTSGSLPDSLAALTEEDSPPPKDPWGTDYVYTYDAEGGNFTITAHGEDGAPGGAGANADIASDRLPSEVALLTAAKKFASYDEKVRKGQEKAQELRERFAPWYYVISDESFRKLQRDRSQLLKARVTSEDGD